MRSGGGQFPRGVRHERLALFVTTLMMTDLHKSPLAQTLLSLATFGVAGYLAPLQGLDHHGLLLRSE